MKKYTSAAKRGRTFIVKSHNKILFKVGPADKQPHTLQDLLNIRFSHQDKNVSKKVDEIVYEL